MDRGILVSIVIPVYNVEDYLEQCLQSVINQTYKNLELIVINDGSTDSSGDIIERYVKKYNNIICVNQKNSGLSYSRNVGLDKSNGKYIYFLDSDDFLESETIAECVELAERENLDILQFDASVYYENNTVTDLCFNYDRSNLLDTCVYSGEKFYARLIKNNCYKSPVWLSFYNRQFLVRNNLRFFNGILHEDELFTVQSLILAKRVRYNPRAYFNRRIRQNSIMTQNVTIKNIDGYLTVAQELSKTYKLIQDREVKELLKNEIIGFYYRVIGHSLHVIEDNRELVCKLRQVRKSVFNDINITCGNKKLIIISLFPNLYVHYLKFNSK